MKSLYTFIFFCAFSFSSMGQASFTEDFESYNANAYLGPQSTVWTTWGKKDGTTEDVKVVTTRALSGTKSIYFSSTAAGGGPTDVVLPMPSVLTKDLYEFSSNFFVEVGKTGYLNFQAVNPVGTKWAMDVYFYENGFMAAAASGAILASSSYKQGAWVNLTIKANISLNSYKLFLDDVEIGTFKLPSNSIASVNFYPANNLASFYVDDVSFKTAPFDAKQVDLRVSEVVAPIQEIAGFKNDIVVEIQNAGLTTVQNGELTLKVGSQTFTKPLTSINLASFKSTKVTFDQVPAAAGVYKIEANVQLTGQTDLDLENNKLNVNALGVVPAPDKMVVAEEATGTWCGWCPRGAIALQRLEKYKDYFIGIAVHNNDPMTVAEYDSGMGSLPSFPGYPSGTVDRNSVIDPGAFSTDFFERITAPAKATLTIGASYDVATKTLKVSPKVNASSALTADYKVVVVLVEDGIKGTGTGYNQANYYANNAAGPMGGYETRPNPVPAAQMVYDHVARAIMGGFGGTKITNALAANQSLLMNFTGTLPAATIINVDKCKLVAMLIAPNGTIENAYYTTLKDAIAAGFVSGVNDEEIITKIDIYPNPTTDYVTIDITLDQSADVAVDIVSNTGQVLTTQNFGKLNGQQQLLIETSNIPTGIYSATLRIDGKTQSRQIVVQH
jgi:hypothetical protein